MAEQFYNVGNSAQMARVRLDGLFAVAPSKRASGARIIFHVTVKAWLTAASPVTTAVVVDLRSSTEKTIEGVFRGTSYDADMSVPNHEDQQAADGICAEILPPRHIDLLSLRIYKEILPVDRSRGPGESNRVRRGVPPWNARPHRSQTIGLPSSNFD